MGSVVWELLPGHQCGQIPKIYRITDVLLSNLNTSLVVIARTALLLRTEMTISRAVKLRALFQEVTLALPEARPIQIWYQMKDMDTVFILIPCGLL